MKILRGAGAWLVSVSVASAQLFVDASAVPPGDGSPGSPFPAIAQATAIATFAESIFVAPGTYEESVVIPFGQPVELVATGGPEVTTWKPATPSSIALEVFDMNFPTQPTTTVAGFTFTGADGPTGIAIATDRSGAQVGIDGCIVRGNRVGILARYEVTVSDSIVVGNEIGLDVPAGGFAFVDGTIVWQNTTDMTGFGNVRFSAGFTGFDESSPGFTSCVFGDPGLWDVDLLDAHLAPGSPCIGAGAFGSDIGLYPFDPGYAPVATFCTSKLASQGCLPRIGSVGSAGVTSLGSFEITATDVVASKNGLFFYGFTRAVLPFFGGVLCTQPPNRRTPIQHSGTTGAPCSGAFTFDFQSHLQSAMDPLLVPGELVYGQYWFRDPADPSGFQVGLTDALRFGIGL